MAQNFWSNFLKGAYGTFPRSYGTSFEESLRQQRIDDERTYEQQQEQKKLAETEANKNATAEAVKNLLMGTTTDLKEVPTLVKNNAPQNLGNFGKGYETEQRLQQVTRPLNPIEEAIKYGQLPQEGRDAVNYYKDNNKPVAPKTPKKLATANGYNSKGEHEIFIKYDDGSEIRIPTGFYKEKNKSNSTGEGSKKFDPKKFNKTLDGFTDGLVKINGLRQQYETDGSEFTRSNINLLNETNEALLHTIISDDEEMNTAVNDFYDEMKETFGDSFRDIEKTKQNELKGKFLETMKQRAIEGDLPMDKFRALSLWVQFKYGYQY